MNVLIDTNVILDLLLRREPVYENAARINILSENGYIRSYISASAVTDIFYIAKKELKDKHTVNELLKNLLKTTRIASVTESGVHEALDMEWDDFEDAIQYVAGRNVSADRIITRNPDDFVNSEIIIVSPDEFIKQIIS